MSKKDPLDGFRGNENLAGEISEFLINAGVSREQDGLFDAARKLSKAQQVTQFLKSPAGQVLFEKHDDVHVKLLQALTATDFKKKNIIALCMDYRISALSLGILVQTVQEADELQAQMEQEQIDEQPAQDVEP